LQTDHFDSSCEGSDPELMRNGLNIGDIDLFEINEAFDSVVLAWAKETGADLDRTNVNGGAIAVGHPLGASGTLLVTRVLHELERTGGRYALISMCCGGGLGTGTLLERVACPSFLLA
jgi:acetyl-CoA C-acetyltransferase